MSFGFKAKAKTSDELREKIVEELAKVKVAQPVHEKDLPLIRAVVESYVDFVGEPAEGKALAISVSGSISVWDGVLQTASVSVGISFVAAE
jgi:hypothetical protein